MIRHAIRCSIIVIILAGPALLVIWNWSDILNFIGNYGEWITSAVVVLLGIAILVCCWWPVFRKKKTGNTCDEPCKDDDCPYPAPGWEYIGGFSHMDDLCIGRLKKRDPRLGPEQQYVVTKDYRVCVLLGDDTTFVVKVPAGMVTDLSSAPRILRWYVGRVGPHLEATIIHDYLYVAWQKKGLTPTDDMRRFADKLMLVAMLEAGMCCKAFLIYWAVRLFGACVFYGRNPEPLKLKKGKRPDCCCPQPDSGNAKAKEAATQAA